MKIIKYTKQYIQNIKYKILFIAAAPTPLFGTSNTNHTAGTGFGSINTGQSTGFGSAFGSTQPNQVIYDIHILHVKIKIILIFYAFIAEHWIVQSKQVCF